ncbi:MAG: hypothetical protein ABSG26_20865 [Bryobacteraceae bacterium]|jgi:hypothetical protein
MGNHVHIVVMPTDSKGLANALGGTHNTGADDTRLIDLTAWTERWTPASWREVLDLGLSAGVHRAE